MAGPTSGFKEAYTSLNGRGKIKGVRATDVTTKPVEWLWRGRIPKGKLTILDGDPDKGKSVVTVDIAARYTTGRSFPDGATCQPGSVVICNVEDAADDTIVPRLKAAGADLDKVHLFSGVTDSHGDKSLLELPKDLPLLEEYVLECEATLLILDPIMTLLGGDASKDQDARKALTPVADMAERTGVSTIGVRHLNKNISLKAIQRGGGNMGLIGVARAGLFFADHPDLDGVKVMAPHKSNLTEKLPSLTFRIVNSPVHGDVARIEWIGTTEHDADTLAADASTRHEKTQLEEAKEFLYDELKDGPMWAKQVFKDARDAGVSDITLKRAKAVMRVKSEKLGTEGWMWSLPPTPDDSPRQHKEEDHHQNDDPLDPLDHIHKSYKENPPYLWEGYQEDQGYQGDHPGHDDPDHDPLYRRAVEALTHGNAPRKALEHYLAGNQDIDLLARSVMRFYASQDDDLVPWKKATILALDEVVA